MLALCLLASATAAPTSGAAKAPIVVGVVVPLTGPASVYGIAAQQGAQVAASLLNNQGGVLGRKVSVALGDDALSPATGVNEMRRVISENHADFVIGGVTSAVGLAQVAAFPQMLMWSLAKADAVTQGGLPYIFATNLPFSRDSSYFYQYMDKLLHTKRFAFLSENSQTGQQRFVYAQQHYGSKMVYSGFFNLTDTDFSVQLAKIAQAKPDVLFLSTASDAIIGQLFRQIAQFGIKVPIELSIGIALSQTSLDASKSVSGKIYSADIYSPLANNSKNKVFVAAFNKQFHHAPDFESALAYDDVMLTAQAMKKSGCVDCYAKISAVLRGHPWQTVRGPFYINQFGLGTTTKLYPSQIINGKIVLLNPGK